MNETDGICEVILPTFLFLSLFFSPIESCSHLSQVFISNGLSFLAEFILSVIAF